MATTQTYDTAWKGILERFFQEFISFCWPKLYNLIDWGKSYSSLEQQLLAISRKYAVGNTLADKLFKVFLKDASEKWIVVHIEVDGRADSNLSPRMFIYACTLYLKYKQKVLSCVILTNKTPKWKPEFSMQGAGCEFSFKYHIVNALEYRKKVIDLAAAKNIFAKVLLIHLQALATKHCAHLEKLQKKILLTKELYQLGYRKREIQALYCFMDWSIALPEDLDVEYHNTIKKFEEEQGMAYVCTAERIGIKKGIEQGINEGLAQGLSQGLAQERNRLASLLKSLLTKKFKNISAIHRQKIKKANTNELIKWINGILTADSIEELFVHS